MLAHRIAQQDANETPVETGGGENPLFQLRLYPRNMQPLPQRAGLGRTTRRGCGGYRREFLRKRKTFFVCLCRLLQSRQHGGPIRALCQHIELPHEHCEAAPAPLVCLAISLDKPLGARKLERQFIIPRSKTFDPRQPLLDAGVFLVVSESPAPPALQAPAAERTKPSPPEPTPTSPSHSTPKSSPSWWCNRSE